MKLKRKAVLFAIPVFAVLLVVSILIALKSVPASPYSGLIAALKKYQDSGWKKYNNPLIADSVLVTSPNRENERLALLSGAAYDVFFLDEINLHYALLDINNDGQPELFIGPKPVNDYISPIFSIYSLREGKPAVVFQISRVNEDIYIYSDGTFSSSYFPSYALGYGSFRRYSITHEGMLKIEYSFQTMPPEDDDSSEPNYYNDEDGTVYTKAQVDEILSQYDKTWQRIIWHPLKDFPES